MLEMSKPGDFDHVTAANKIDEFRANFPCGFVINPSFLTILKADLGTKSTLSSR